MSAKILVVEDEQDMTELLAYNLKGRGYEVLTAINGLEALNHCNTNVTLLPFVRNTSDLTSAWNQ